MEAPKLYHHVAFRITVYALLATIGGINIWGENLANVPITHSQTVSPVPILAEVQGTNDMLLPNDATVTQGCTFNQWLPEETSGSVPVGHVVQREFGIEHVFQAYGAFIRIFL